MKKKIVEEIQKKFIYGVLAILSKTIITKRQKRLSSEILGRVRWLKMFFAACVAFFPIHEYNKFYIIEIKKPERTIQQKLAMMLSSKKKIFCKNVRSLSGVSSASSIISVLCWKKIFGGKN